MRKKQKGFTLIELLVVIAIIGILASMMLPALARAKAKANRVKCVNNVHNVYMAGLNFGQDNNERLPWQLDSLGVRNHFTDAATAAQGYGTQLVGTVNEVKAHPSSQHAAACYGLTAMKVELVTPKILLSPCDPARSPGNEIVNEYWHLYNTKANGLGGGIGVGKTTQLGNGCSYVLCRGADTARPSSVYAMTRNAGNDNMAIANWKWIGSDNPDPSHVWIMAGLNTSQGQYVAMDGSAKQSTNADFGSNGPIILEGARTTGGVAKGRTSARIIRGVGLDR